MHKKILHSVLVFSCIVTQAIIIADESNAQENPFAQLPTHLRWYREDPDNAIYADEMVNGVPAIQAAKNKKMQQIESDRKAQKDEVSSNQSYMGSERVGTKVYNYFKEIDDKLNKYKADHEANAKVYIDCTTILHNELSKNAHEELAVNVVKFERMERALRLCPLDDHACYERYKAPLYNKMTDKKYRNAKKEESCKIVLAMAHEKGIPVTDSELRYIVQKDPQYQVTMARINELDKSIDELPEKKKQELEDQKNKEEQERQQKLQEQLMKNQN